MKKIFLGAAYCALQLASHAQTFDEWFFQRKTRIKYLVQQLAALTLLQEASDKGEQIVANGVDSIEDLVSTDYDMHNQHIRSLWNVNAGIQCSPLKARIWELQAAMASRLHASIQRWVKRGMEYLDVLKYIGLIGARLTDEILADQKSLTDLTTDGVLLMTDDERIKAIQVLYVRTRRRDSLIRTFCRSTDQMIYFRSSEVNELNILKKLIYE
jgi:hypothetical protein